MSWYHPSQPPRWLRWLPLALGLALIGGACAPAAATPTEAPPPTPTEAAAEAPTEAPTEAPAEEPTATEEPAPAEAGRVKIGVLNPTTGQLALFGEQNNTGIRLYFDNNEVQGAEVELVFADTAGDPQQALEQARRLVAQERVDLLMGLINSAVAVPLAQFANQEEVPLIMGVAGARAATSDEGGPFVFRTAMANGQQDRPLGWYTAENLGLTRAATFAWDFLVGEERGGAFSDAFTNAGGEIVSVQKPPLGTSDYGPYIGQIDPSQIDVIYAFFAGPGAIAFMQQLQDFGFTPEVRVAASDYFTAGVLEPMGQTALGLVQGAQYIEVLDNPENRAFQELYDAEVGGTAGVYIEEGYLVAEVAARAIAAVGGDLTDKQAFLDAVAALEFNGPAGPIRFDENGQSVRNVYITRVVEEDGSVTHEVVDTIEDVSQDWMP